MTRSDSMSLGYLKNKLVRDANLEFWLFNKFNTAFPPSANCLKFPRYLF